MTWRRATRLPHSTGYRPTRVSRLLQISLESAAVTEQSNRKFNTVQQASQEGSNHFFLPDFFFFLLLLLLPPASAAVLLVGLGALAVMLVLADE